MPAQKNLREKKKEKKKDSAYECMSDMKFTCLGTEQKHKYLWTRSQFILQAELQLQQFPRIKYQYHELNRDKVLQWITGMGPKLKTRSSQIYSIIIVSYHLNVLSG